MGLFIHVYSESSSLDCGVSGATPQLVQSHPFTYFWGITSLHVSLDPRPVIAEDSVKFSLARSAQSKAPFLQELQFSLVGCPALGVTKRMRGTSVWERAFRAFLFWRESWGRCQRMKESFIKINFIYNMYGIQFCIYLQYGKWVSEEDDESWQPTFFWSGSHMLT